MKLDYTHMFKRLAVDVDLDQFTYRYCAQRLKREGLQFLTVTLPKLSKAVLRSLELGSFDRPTDFAWKGRSLRYFRSFLNKIFDYRTGKVLENVDPLALWQCRQLCEYAYKLALPFSDEHLEDAEQSFIKEDAELSASAYDTRFVDQLRKDFETHYRSFSGATVSDVLDTYRPRPGPGTFSGKTSFERRSKRAWYTRKETDYAYPKSFRAYGGYFRPYHRAPVQGEAKQDPVFSEVLFVPKDSRGPRTIVREPYAVLSCQMAFNAYACKALEKASRYRINFQDQRVNRDLAMQSSKTKENATLDLKSASDRVSYSIMLHIFRNSPLKKFILSSTRFTMLPVSKKVVRLSKLSGMGSGLTFPMMSLLIHLTITRRLVDRTGLSYAKARSLVYVYGDDVIVPTKYTSIAFEALKLVKLQVNYEKSFITSNFRESCGGDYFMGQDVAPVRLKLSGAEPTVHRSTHELHLNNGLRYVELERHCRELVKAGLVGLADFFYSHLEKCLGRLPAVCGDSPVLGRYRILPCTYGVDGSGNYEHVKVIMPVGKVERFEGDVHVALGRSLIQVNRSVLEQIMSPPSGRTFGEVMVPRSVRYRRCKISAFRLMG